MKECTQNIQEQLAWIELEDLKVKDSIKPLKVLELTKLNKQDTVIVKVGEM